MVALDAQLAREALVDLSSRSAARVDEDWRGQVADYLLGQQTGPEGTATRGHLKRSEAARLWALSLLDSLDHLYDESDLPVIPEGEAAPGRSRERERTRDRVREPEPAVERERRPRRERSSPLGGLGGLGGRTERPARQLSADAETVVRRRRIAAAAAGATALLFILLIWPVGLLTGDDDGGSSDSSSASADGQPQVLGQLLLRPQSGEKGVGIALITEQDGERSLLVQARGLKPTKEGQAYEVWLFNSQQDATSMGAQLTDRQGNYQGAGRLPENYQDFQYLDISREQVDQNAAHSGDSVLRGKLSDIQAASGTDTTGTSTTGTETAPTDTQDSGSPLGN